LRIILAQKYLAGQLEKTGILNRIIEVPADSNKPVIAENGHIVSPNRCDNSIGKRL
jgi:hypothetical protein